MVGVSRRGERGEMQMQMQINERQEEDNYRPSVVVAQFVPESKIPRSK